MINSRVLAGVLVALYPLGWHNGAMAETGSYGVFRSQDRGQTWSRSDTGLPSGARINAFGKLPNAVLAGTDDGVYISRDRGLTWKRAIGTASGAGRILSFATMGERVYAGTDRNRLAVSLDGGINWALNSTPFRKVRTLLTHEGALYAGSDAEGVFVSQDGGHSWTSIGQGSQECADLQPGEPQRKDLCRTVQQRPIRLGAAARVMAEGGFRLSSSARNHRRHTAGGA